MISCQELSELVSAYIEGTLDAGERAGLERHLEVCSQCVDHVGQVRTTIALCGRVTAETLSEPARAELAAVFAAWKSER